MCIFAAMHNASGVRFISHICTIHDQQTSRHVTHTHSPFPTWRETRNGQRHENQYPEWLKYRFLVKWAVCKEIFGDHSGFQTPFQWSFRVSWLQKCCRALLQMCRALLPICWARLYVGVVCLCASAAAAHCNTLWASLYQSRVLWILSGSKRIATFELLLYEFGTKDFLSLVPADSNNLEIVFSRSTWMKYPAIHT